MRFARLKKFGLRTVYAVPLLGIGQWAYDRGGWLWVAFLGTLCMVQVGEVVYQIRTCSVKMRGYEDHANILVILSVVGFTLMTLLRCTDQGKALIFMGALMVMAFDIFSLVFGQVLGWNGGHKIAPKESPNKTWEGLFGGTISCIAVGLYEYNHLHEITISRWVMYVTIILVPLIAYFGDINESMAKRRLAKKSREVTLKDFSNILGPHGGISDRFDAMTAVFALNGMIWLLAV